ncbi:hypothetical protein BH11CYA1_BH11CYA1_38850 [soil metagenome]
MPESSDNNNLGTLKVGSFIGGTYRVLGFIGQGGMGFVYKVEHMMMAKVLALKILRSEQVSEEVWKRFRIEAQAIARLDHANVVRIYDMSQTEAGLPYYTMDLLDGESLADYLDEYYRLSVREALPIFRQVCAGLAYAHDRGIIHRDIKPGNIMLLADAKENAPPIVKIVDFGIAKLTSFDNGFGQGLTRPGEVFGSPLYMSPEQCSGQQLDHRTDMYSVGVTMFQALTGRPPLLGKTAIETTAMHQSVVPPAMAGVIELEEGEEPIFFPSQLEEIVARLLAKSPNDRFDSLADVAMELLALERGEVRRGQVSSAGARSTSADSGMAPYAVAESARRRAGYINSQVLTFGQTETGSEGHARRQSKTILLALASLALLVIVVGAIALIVFRPTAPNPKIETSKELSLLISDVRTEPILTDVGAIINDAAPLGKVNSEQARLITDYLASHKQYYSTARAGKAQGPQVFEFPATFCLGKFSYSLASGVVSKMATGRLIVEKPRSCLLEAEPLVAQYPALLERFRPEEISWLELNRIDVKSAKLFASIVHLSSITHLVVTGGAIDSSDLKYLEKLPLLDHLEVSGEKIKGDDLANSKCLSHLQILSVAKLANPTPLLKKLSELNCLKILNVDYSELGKQDCIYLAKMTNLKELSMKGNPVTDDDLKPLVALQNLTSIDMKNCEKLTKRSVTTLGKLKNLVVITVPSSLDDVDVAKLLQLQLPNLKAYKGFY